jgi:hypothetical protein
MCIYRGGICRGAVYGQEGQEEVVNLFIALRKAKFIKLQPHMWKVGDKLTVHWNDGETRMRATVEKVYKTFLGFRYDNWSSQTDRATFDLCHPHSPKKEEDGPPEANQKNR